MFGEDLLVGARKVTFDHKNRFIIPKFTLVETNDILVFLLTRNDYFDIYPRSYIEKLVSLRQSLVNSSDQKTLDSLCSDIESFYSRTLTDLTADKQHRVLLPGDIKERFGIANITIFQGAGDHARLFRNQEAYEKHLERVR